MRRLFYGWYVLAASFALLFVNAGAQSVFGLLVKPMQAEFGWSRGSVTSAALVNLAVFAVSILVTGRLYDRYGPKWVIAGSALLVSLGFSLMWTIQSLGQFVFYYGVLVAAGFGGTSIPLFGSIMGRWFEKRRGLAISLALAGFSVGQFVLIPLLSDTIAIDGWRTACLWIAAITGVANLALAFGVVRGDPDQLGVRPYGSVDSAPVAAASVATPDAAVETREAVTKRAAVTPDQDLSLGQAMRTRSLWLFTAVMFVCGAGDYLLITHLVAMVADRGMTEALGASMLAWSGLLGLLALLVTGPAIDAVGNKLPVALTFTLRVALFTMMIFTKGTTAFWIFALGMGFTLPVTAPILPALVGKLYGVRHIGFICGFVTTIHMVGGGVWSYLGGAIFDRTQNYDLILLISAIVSALAVVCALLIREERHLPPTAETSTT